MAAAKGRMSVTRMIIDGGGSSTAVGVYTGTAEVARTVLPPYRPTPEGLHTEALCHHLATWGTSTSVPIERIAFILVGMAGLWNTEEKRAYADAFGRNFEAAFGIAAPQIMVVADIELVQLAALRGRAGIVLIGGTGSMALGVSASGSMYRCGGWGPRVDDAGSGFWIGRLALRAVARMLDGTGAATLLIRPVAAWLRVSPDDEYAIATRLRSVAIDGVARLAQGVFSYADEADVIAQDIRTAAARALAALVHGIVRRNADVPPLVVLFGSLWLHTPLREAVETLVCAEIPKAEFEYVDDVLVATAAVLDAA